MSSLLVAAKTMTLVVPVLKPSISTKSLKEIKTFYEIVKKAKKSNNNVKNLYRFWEAKF